MLLNISDSLEVLLLIVTLKNNDVSMQNFLVSYQAHCLIYVLYMGPLNIKIPFHVYIAVYFAHSTTRAGVNFPTGLEHPIACLHGRTVGCLSWVLGRRLTVKYRGCIEKCAVWCLTNLIFVLYILACYTGSRYININGIRKSVSAAHE